MSTRRIIKTLSSNDVGDTGGHQAGMLIPKRSDILSFFPKLAAKEKNPRAAIVFIDDSSQEWTFSFIYYNNKFFGGTRNEYRLTGMTRYIRSNSLKAGDSVELSKESEFEYRITNLRSECEGEENERFGFDKKTGRLVVSAQWVVVDF